MNETPPRSRAVDAPVLIGWAVIAVSLVVAAVIGVVRAVAVGGVSDFTGFYDGARIAWTRHELSTHPLVTRYPFTFQVLLAPLGALPLLWAISIWNLLNFAALLHLPRLFEQLSGVNLRRQLVPWLILLPFTVDNLVLGQSAPILMWLVTAGLALAMRGASLRGGLLLGWAACLKVIPAVFLAVPWARRRIFGTLGGSVIAVAAITVLGGWLVGFHPLLPNTMHWWRYGTREHSLRAIFDMEEALRYNNQSPASVLARTFGDITAPAKGAIRVCSLSRGAVHLMFLAWVAAAGAAWIAVAWRVRRSQNPSHWLGLYALTAIGMLVVSPIVWTHYFLWLLPAMIYLVDRRRLLLVWTGVAWIGLALIPARALGIHMLWAMGLFVAVARAMCGQAEPQEQVPDLSSSPTVPPQEGGRVGSAGA